MPDNDTTRQRELFQEAIKTWAEHKIRCAKSAQDALDETVAAIGNVRFKLSKALHATITHALSVASAETLVWCMHDMHSQGLITQDQFIEGCAMVVAIDEFKATAAEFAEFETAADYVKRRRADNN